MPGVAAAIRLRGIFFLQLGGVGQHDLREVGGARCAEDAAAEAAGDEPRQPADVIEVRVRQHERVDGCRIDRQRLPVALAQFLEPLEHAAVDEHADAGRFRADASTL